MTQATDPDLLGLVGDVGGTNARFALAYRRDGRLAIDQPASFRAADYRSGDDALKAYLDQLKAPARPAFAMVAAAGPIDQGQVTFTNNTDWRFSEDGLEKAGGFRRARLINDFTAQALSIDHLQDADVRHVGGPNSRPREGSAAIIGPGTGFGAGARIDDGQGRAILTSEGGHTGFSPEDQTEVEIIRHLMERFGRVSVERLLSGPGLLNLYQTLGLMRGEPAPCAHPDDVTRQALAGEPLSRVALERFCAILGSVAGDFALAYGAVAGVYVSGGIAPAVIDILAASDFRRRFEAKGRMSDYLKAIPTFVVMQPHAALVGAASRLAGLAAEAAA
ncbi:MAG TPA: glucokinase [Caulobacteraceae bacterium]|jgi:glucokinase|nr:glucokinase [Caulobacteraceae bacterium]